ncbi:MAG: hypothetical protein ACU83V_06980 [Gammaproteobacteria bacterium]
MADKFANVPADAETRILFQQEARIGEYDVLYQKWVWEGISAESLIFVNDDIAGLEDDDLEKQVKALPLFKQGC